MEKRYKIKYDYLHSNKRNTLFLSHNIISVTRYDEFTIKLQNQKYLSLMW